MQETSQDNFRTTGFLHSSWLETNIVICGAFCCWVFSKEKTQSEWLRSFWKAAFTVNFPSLTENVGPHYKHFKYKEISMYISGIHFLCFMPPFIRWLICLWSESFEEQMWEIISRRKDQFHKKAHCNFFFKLKETAHVGQRESHMCGILFLLISMCGIEWYFLRKNKVTMARTCTSP